MIHIHSRLLVHYACRNFRNKDQTINDNGKFQCSRAVRGHAFASRSSPGPLKCWNFPPSSSSSLSSSFNHYCIKYNELKLVHVQCTSSIECTGIQLKFWRQLPFKVMAILKTLHLNNSMIDCDLTDNINKVITTMVSRPLDDPT